MSSEMVLYILSASRKPVYTISLTFDCSANLNAVCALIIVRFEDGHEVLAAGHTIFGALRNLMSKSRTEPEYWQEWTKLD